MKTRLMETTTEPDVRIHVNGNLKLSGWDRPELEVQASDLEGVELSEESGRVSLQTTDDCVVRVPSGANLQLESVYGNAMVSQLSGSLNIVKIGGNLRLAQVGSCRVEKVYGNLRAERVRGELRLSAVYGNTIAQNIEGSVQIEEKVKGNLVVRQASGVDASALGNATILSAMETGEELRVEASGNIHCTLAGQSGAKVDISSQSCQIRLKTKDTSQLIEERAHAFSFGEGGARVHLRAKGFVQLTSLEGATLPEGDFEELTDENLEANFSWNLEEDPAAISEEINDLIDQQMDALESRLNEQLGKITNLGEDPEFQAEVDEILDQARQYSSRAAQRARERAQAAAVKAQMKLSRKLEKARKKAERKARKTGGRPRRFYSRRSSSTSGPPGSGEPVSEEEHLMILKMLEENKISMEEAEALLAALEGNEG